MAKHMALHFIPVRYNGKVELPQELVEKLPARIVLFTTTQFHDQLPEMKKRLEKNGKTVILLRPKHAAREGQLLGCGIERWDVDADCFLYVGDGLFHPKALVINNDLPVFCYDPKAEKWFEFSDKDIEKAKQKQQAALKTFYSSEKIGVLVTTKYGQQRLELSLKLQKQFPEKEFFILLYDTLDFNSLEDFNFVECFVNTMCPRLGLDDTNRMRIPIIDVGELGVEW